MKSVGELFKELGFNKDAPLETQKAFIKHLISAVNQSTNHPVAEQQVQAAPASKIVAAKKGEQLEFDFSESKRVS
jgi:hypothetical protein